MASSALGDYVHLYAENYMKYGVNKIGNSKEKFRISAAKKLINSRINVIPAVSDTTINELKRRMLLNSAAQEQADKQKITGLTQERINLVYEMLSKNTQSGVMKEYLNKGMGDFLSYEGTQNITKGHSQAALDKQKAAIREWDRELALLEKDGYIDEVTGQRLLEIYNRATGSNQKMEGDINSLKGQLQNNIESLQFTYCYNQLAGQIGETLVAMCGDNISELAEDSIKDTLNKSILGSSTSKISIDTNLLSQMNSKKIKKFAHYEHGNKYVLNASTKNKVDVEIQVGGEDVYASVKNYASDINKHGVGLTTTSLLYPLLFLEQADKFGTHWTNLHARSWNLGEVGAADMLLEQEIAYEALSRGNPFKKGVNSANTFVFIDRKKGQIYIKNIKDMLSFETISNTFSFSPSIRRIDIINKRAPFVGARINNIMSQIHQTKIKVSLKRKVFS